LSGTAPQKARREPNTATKPPVEVREPSHPPPFGGAHRLGRLLKPQTVALVGGGLLVPLVESCRRIGFEGEIWPVNPHRRRLAGLPCYARLEDLPAPPDVAFLAINRHRTIEAVQTLARMGAGSAVCYASLYAEQGPDGAVLQRRLVEAAGKMPILGPNCYGLINAVDGVALWPDQAGCGPVDEGVALISQSGNVALNLSFQRRGLPVSHLITVGNQAALGIEDLMEELLQDPRVKGIGLFLEAVRDPHRFVTVTRRAVGARIPVVALLVGRSRRGAEIARTHTASMTGMADAYGALFDRGGVIGVNTITELLETLGVLVGIGPLRGNRVVSLSCSGGEASYVADRSEGQGLDFAPFSPAQAGRIDRILDGRVKVGNPLDYHTFIWDDRTRLEQLFTEVFTGPQDATMLVLDVPSGDGDFSAFRKTAGAMMAAVRSTGRRGLVASNMPENLDADLAGELAAHGVTPVRGIDAALVGLGAAVRWGEAVHGPLPPFPAAAPPPASETIDLDEVQAKARLRGWGVPVPRGQAARPEDACRVADAIGYPVVVKALGLDHKTEQGAVRLGLATTQDLDEATRAISGRWPGQLLIEEMVDGVVAELLVSVRRQWPVGWLVTIGAGGVLADLVADLVRLLAPVTPDEVTRALQELRVGQLLAGYRGGTRADIGRCAATICDLVNGAVGDGDTAEVEVNPLLVTPTRAVAADALMAVED